MKATPTRNAVLDRLLGLQPWTPPSTYYVALYTDAPTEAGGGTEVTGAGYARVAVANDLVNFPAADNGEKANATLIGFPAPTDLWGEVVAFGFHSAASGDVLVLWGVLDSPLLVDSGDIAPTFDAGTIQFEEV
jgi:hypothetical protein